jgi:protein involved in polysaccharide export with SLBB domain
MSISNLSRQLGGWGAVCGLLFVALCMSGCQTQQQGQQFAEVPASLAPTSSPAPTATGAPNPTTPRTQPALAPAANAVPVSTVTSGSGSEAEALRVGDSLTVVFTDTPVQIPNYDEKIKDDGTITLHLDKTFKAAGLSRGELEKKIRDCYVPSYYKQMTVTVKHQDSTRWYYVNGEVRAPNRQIYAGRITVIKAIASVGGFTDFANKKKVKLTRVDGRTQVINCVKALENPSLDPEVFPGDTIHVPRRIW